MYKSFTGLSFLFVMVLGSCCEAAPTQSSMVPMRDGIKLSTDIYLPKGEGPWPVILVRTPYSKKGLEGFAIQANQRGYALVVQDFRGRFESEGEDYPVFLHGGWGKYQDGYDTVEWIASQNWCNGKVGGMGISGPAIDLNMMAPSRPPHLVCQYVAVAFSSMYHQCAYQGGVFRKELMENWLSQNAFSPENLRIIRSHPHYDDFWKEFDCEKVAHRVNVPVLFLGGWYDIFNIGTINSFLTIQKNGDKGAKGKCRLVMEAYGHGRSDELVFPEPERPRFCNIGNWLDWFDIWMKNDGKGIDDIPMVQYYVMGDPDDKGKYSNIWKSASDWPVEAEMTPFYFMPDGTLAFVPPDNEEGNLSYEYDPQNPVPTSGGANLTIPAGPRDQRPVEDRQDVLLFTSRELEKPMEVTGHVKVRLWASSSAEDTDFTAKLCDVYPDGRSIIVADGIIRASHRNSLEKAEPVKPGKIYEFEIDLWHTSIVFSPDHRIRVAISSSNSTRFEPNPNQAKNTIYMDNKHPSHIILPVVNDMK